MSSNDNLVLHLAPILKSELAQKALFEINYPGLLYKLASNKYMTRQTWWKLVKIKNKVNLTTKLVTDGPRDLDDEQAAYLLKDRRTAVRVEVLACSLAHISHDFGIQLIEDGKLTEYDASRILHSMNIPFTLIKPVAKLSNSLSKLEVLKYSDIYSPAEVIEILSENTTPGSGRTLMAGLFDLRKELIPLLLEVKDSPQLLLPLSQSRHIFTDEQFLSLIKQASQAHQTAQQRNYSADSAWEKAVQDTALNIMRHPNASPAVVEAAEQFLLTLTAAKSYLKDELLAIRANRCPEQVTVNWKRLTVPRRTAALGTFKGSSKSYPTLFKLNPTPPTPSQRSGLYIDLSRISTENSQRNVARFYAARILSQSQLDSDIAPKLDAAGQPAWQTFFELALNWHDSVEDLLQTTLSLTQSA